MVDVLQLATFLVILVIGIAWYLSYSAARLDRLHAKAEGAMSALDAALVRRAEAALELANNGALDPASALIIADAATESIERTTEQPVTDDLLDGQHFGGREQVETDLSEALRAALTAEVVPALRERDEELGVRVARAGRVERAAGAARPPLPERRRPRGAPGAGQALGEVLPAGGLRHLPEPVSSTTSCPRPSPAERRRGGRDRGSAGRAVDLHCAA